MNTKRHLAMLGLFGAIMHSMDSAHGATPNRDVIEKSKKLPNKVIPKGCKEYYFTKSGKSFLHHPETYEIVFVCVASNEKSAENKFNKWIENNPKT